jgi:hypothetical protein
MLLVMFSYLNGTLKGSHAQANARLWLGQPVATDKAIDIHFWDANADRRRYTR